MYWTRTNYLSGQVNHSPICGCRPCVRAAVVIVMAEKELKDAAKELENKAKFLEKGALGFQNEFMEFLKKYQVIGLAVAFVIGAAATKLITAMVQDIIMPIVSVIIPGGDWRQAVFQVGPIKFLGGDFVGAIIDFVIIALVVFLLVKYVMKGDITKKV
jgi:large conductance mechanosensitive channel